MPSNPLGEGPAETPETLLERLGFPHRIQHRQVMPDSSGEMAVPIAKHLLQPNRLRRSWEAAVVSRVIGDTVCGPLLSDSGNGVTAG